MRSWRIQLLVIAAVAAIVRIAAYEVEPVLRADVRIYDDMRLAAGSVTYRLAEAIVVPFDPLPYLLVVAVVVGVVLHTAGRAMAIPAAVLLIGATATTQLLKPLLAEPRVAGDWLPDDAWPSGHTTAAAALGLTLLLVTPPGRRVPVALIAGLATLAEGAALVGLGSHYPSDVVGGMCVAAAWGVVAVAVRGRAE